MELLQKAKADSEIAGRPMTPPVVQQAIKQVMTHWMRL
jgi:hypothetical protein